MDTHQLAQKYAPILVFSNDEDRRPENFYPMDAEAYIRASALYRPGQKKVIPRGRLLPERLSQIGPAGSRGLYLVFASEDLMAGLPPEAAQRVSLWKVLRDGWERFLSGVDPRTPTPVPAIAGDADAETARLACPMWQQRAFALADTALDVVDALSDWVWLQSAFMPALHFVAPQSLVVSVWREARDRYAPYDLRHSKVSRPVLYYSVEDAGTCLVLHYWFFYAYNDWATGHRGHNDHEGDWESIYLVLEHDPPHAPRWIAYAAHLGVNLERATSPEVEWCHNHPVVYVGCGSHASYFRPGIYNGRDRAAGDGNLAIGPQEAEAYRWPRLPANVRPRKWRTWRLQNLHDVPWAWTYTGNWGTRFRYRWLGRTFHELHGTSGPGGPVWQPGTGTKRPQWVDPMAWLGFRRHWWQVWKPQPLREPQPSGYRGSGK